MGSDWAANVLRSGLNLQRGESVLVMTDEPLARVRLALCNVAERLGAGAVHSYGLRARTFTAIPASLLRRVREADVIISLLSDLDLTRESPVMRAALAAFREGGRGRWAYGAQIDETVLHGELAADLSAVAAAVDGLAARLAGADRVRITAAAGTDLTLRIGGRPWHKDSGVLTAPGSFGNLPGGEVFTAPLERSAEGRLVVDLALGDLPLDRPVVLTFREGRVTGVQGGQAARELEHRLGDDRWAWTIGEFGVGANPFVRPRGRAALDEKAQGTAHIALGGNRSFGGENPASTHYDCVIRELEIDLDGHRLSLTR